MIKSVFFLKGCHVSEQYSVRKNPDTERPTSTLVTLSVSLRFHAVAFPIVLPNTRQVTAGLLTTVTIILHTCNCNCHA